MTINTASLTLKEGGNPIQVRQLRKAFGQLSVLHNLDLDVPAGQFVAIVGRSGCGKSTLLRLLAGLDHASDGELNSGTQSLQSLREDTRLMFQDDRLLPWKRVIDNVGLGLKGSWRSEALQALEEVGLADKADNWPAQLSGGQRQRVALARALIHKPRLLLLDEPLGALDALTRLEMQQLLERIWQEHRFTVVLVTHDVPEAVQLSDRVIVLEEGRIGLDLEVSLARPRQPASAESAAYSGQVLAAVLGESTLTPAVAASPSQTESTESRVRLSYAS